MKTAAVKDLAEDFLRRRADEKRLGPGLRFELIAPPHTPFIIRWRNAPDNNRNFVAHNQLTEADQNRFLASYWERDRVDFVLILTEGGASKPVGVFNITGLSSARPEIGKMIGDPEMRGRGLAKSGTMALLDFGFDVLGLPALYAKTRTDNTGNIKLNEKLGFAIASTETVDGAEYYWMRLDRAARA